MRRVLIAGGGGYLGLHLAHFLSQQGLSVRGLGRSSPPIGWRGEDWFHADITEPHSMRLAVADCEAIIHLASPSLAAAAEDPTQAQAVNVRGTRHLLEAAAAANVKRFVFFSTGQVYGGKAQLPNHEDGPVCPDSAYGET